MMRLKNWKKRFPIKKLLVFISCKTCAVDTDAINELAILRDRFGGDRRAHHGEEHR